MLRYIDHWNLWIKPIAQHGGERAAKVRHATSQLAVDKLRNRPQGQLASHTQVSVSTWPAMASKSFDRLIGPSVTRSLNQVSKASCTLCLQISHRGPFFRLRLLVYLKRGEPTLRQGTEQFFLGTTAMSGKNAGVALHGATAG